MLISMDADLLSVSSGQQDANISRLNETLLPLVQSVSRQLVERFRRHRSPAGDVEHSDNADRAVREIATIHEVKILGSEICSIRQESFRKCSHSNDVKDDDDKDGVQKPPRKKIRIVQDLQ